MERRKLAYILELRGYRRQEIVRKITAHHLHSDGSPISENTVASDLMPGQKAGWLPKVKAALGMEGRTAEGIVALQEHARDLVLVQLEQCYDPFERGRLLRTFADVNAQVLAMCQSLGLLPRVPDKLEVTEKVGFEVIAREYVQEGAAPALLPGGEVQEAAEVVTSDQLRLPLSPNGGGPDGDGRQEATPRGGGDGGGPPGPTGDPLDG